MGRFFKQAAELEGLSYVGSEKGLLRKLLDWARDGKVGKAFYHDGKKQFILVPGNPTEQALAQTLAGEKAPEGAYQKELDALSFVTLSDLRAMADETGFEDDFHIIDNVYKKREYRKQYHRSGGTHHRSKRAALKGRTAMIRREGREKLGTVHPRIALREAKLVRKHLAAKDRLATKWEKLPRGWTEESLKSFWNSIGGSVSACVDALEESGAVDNPGAFCASLKDKVAGEKWRHEPRKRKTRKR